MVSFINLKTSEHQGSNLKSNEKHIKVRRAKCYLRGNGLWEAIDSPRDSSRGPQRVLLSAVVGEASTKPAFQAKWLSCKPIRS